MEPIRGMEHIGGYDQTGRLEPHDGCPLCLAEKVTPWYFENDTMWVADCDSCDEPMFVLKRHSHLPAEQELELMVTKAREMFGEEPPFDFVRRRIPDHFHFHVRVRYGRMFF